MKKIFLFLMMAVITASVSCTRDRESFGNGDAEEVAVTVTADLATVTRALNPGSQNSGLDNVDETAFDVRYQMEVWYDGACVRNGLLNIEEIEKPSTTTFTVNLARGKTYQIVIWADLVEKGSEDDLHYDTSGGLNTIVMNTTDYAFCDESKDAYFVTHSYTVPATASAGSLSLTLQRPLAKIRFIANDYDATESADVDLTSFTAYYLNGTDVYTDFNAVTGEVGATTMPVGSTAVFECTPEALAGTEMLVFYDYLFVPTANAEDGISVGFSVSYDDDSDTFTSNYKNDAIVVKPNMLTTVKGPLFTTLQTLNVIIDDTFGGTLENEVDPLTSPVYIDEVGYPTIAAAMAEAVSGNTITVLAGTFAEDVTVKPGVTINGAGPATIITGYIILGADSGIQNLKSYYLGSKIAGGTTRTAVHVNGNGITIDNVIFETGDTRTFNDTAKPECIVTSGTNFTFTNNTISAPYWKGIYINDSENCTITGNIFNNLNPFSVDNCNFPFEVSGNNFQRTSSTNTQLIHLIDNSLVAVYKSGLPTQLQWDTVLTQDLITLISDIKTENQWSRSGMGNFVRPVRVQSNHASGFDRLVSGDTIVAADWKSGTP